MGAECLSVVTDAGPMIHLAEIDCLHVLSVCSQLHVPDVVWQEILGHVEEDDPKFPDMLAVQHHVLPQQEVEEFTSTHNLEHLHAGERSCFLLCHTLHISTLLTDDLAVRDAARQFDMTPVGSLGVLVRAFHKGFLDLSETEEYMLDLQDKSSLFVTKTVVELAIEQLHQYRFGRADFS